MNTTDHLLVSLRKTDINSPWIISTMNESGSLFRYTIGRNGKSAVGPRLNQLLKKIDKTEKRFPYEYGMNLISNPLNRTAIINIMGESISYTEITLSTYKFISNNFSEKSIITPESNISISNELVISESSEEPINNSPLMRASFTNDVNFSETVQNRTITEEYTVNSINRFWIFLQPNTIKVLDGDTITGNILGYGWPNEMKIPESIGEVNLTIGSNVTVRYIGIDSFEIIKENSDNTYGLKQNKESAKRYGVDLTDINDCAKEAQGFNRSLIKINKVMAVSLQWDTLSNEILLDTTGKRLMGDVFSTSYDSIKEAQHAASDDKFRGINLNKEILKKMYSKNEILFEKYPKMTVLPLAEYDDARKYNTNPSISTSGWREELGLKIPPVLNDPNKSDNNDDSKYQTDEEIEKEINDNGNGEDGKEVDIKKPTTKIDISIDGFINNTTDYVIPYDDRLINQQLYNFESTLKDDMPYDYSNRVRIGDVMLDIPPLSIQMTRQQQNEKVKVMRSKSSLQKQIGSSRVMLTLDLYLHNFESINGYERDAYLGKGNIKKKYFMDGLRPLIAQFKKAPFLPIDNEYINEQLDIHNVALRNIQISTVPNFPESLTATIVLEKFDATPYLMTTDKLADVINYPLLRWHYQQLLNEPEPDEEPWKDYLPTIDRLDNRFGFKIIDENELSNRATLIREFRNMKTPIDKKAEKKDIKTDTGKKYEDSKRASKLLRHYENYLKLVGNSTKKYNDEVSVGQKYTNLAGKELKERQEKAIKNGIKVYGENEEKKGFANYIQLVEKNQGLFKFPGHSGFIPHNFTKHATNSTSAYDIWKKDFKKVTYDNMHVTEYVIKNNIPGIAQIAFLDKENAKKFKKFNTGVERKDNSSQCLIPMKDVSKNEAWLTELKKIASYKNKFEAENKDYKDKYDYLSAQIDKTEEDVKMRDWEIPNMIPISLNVAMENVFTSVQIQNCETPTLQFMGGQDPYIQIEFETDEYGVQQTEALMKKTGEYVRLYRDSLISGFIQIDNPLVNLFGVKAVLPETIKYDTVPNYPDRKIVTLILTGFDKTQRRQEALYGITGGNPSETLKDRAMGKYRPEKDSFYVVDRMKNQELYPDLQMPRVEELEYFLKNSKIDTKTIQWENRTDQVFLDPDFYISSRYTYRKLLKEFIDGGDGVEFQWQDMTGIKGYTSTKGAGPIDVLGESDSSVALQQEQDTDNIDPNFEWKLDMFSDISKSSSEDKDDENKKSSSTKVIKPPKIENTEVNKYYTRDPKTGKAPYETVPSFNDWKKWPLNNNKSQSDYNKWKKTLKELNEKEVWHYLAKAVANNFPQLAFADKELEIIKNVKPIKGKNIESKYTKDSKNLIGKYSISSSDFVYAVMYELATGDSLSNGEDPTKEAKNPKEWTKARLTSEAIGYTFQRMLGYIKAILSVESGWQQFNNGVPKTSNINEDRNPTRVGISGVDISKVSDVSTAQQITWGWKRNIDYMISGIKTYYKKAKDSPYKEIKARSLDWAIASHSGVEMPSVLEKGKNGDKEEEYLDNKISPNSLGYYNKIDSTFYSLYSIYTTQMAGFLYTTPNGKVIEDVRFAYRSDIEYDYNKVTGMAKPVSGITAITKDPEEYTSTKTDENGDHVSSSDPVEKQKEVLDNLLVNTWDTEKQFKSMFTDMLQTDHQGRMVRAFPTYSLYIIDEGKFFNKFNIWDNFYGYNAISSIDVYKSRKMVADTAIIEMSNMYGGLTTKRKDMEYGDLNMPAFFSSVFWNQYVKDVPVEDLLDAKKDLYKSMLLQTGARVHLRMGYGADVRYLPTVFNGTITEMNTGDIVQLVCQGDGLELSNVISGSPNDENKGLFMTVEPSNLMGNLLTSKGSWMKDYINRLSDGEFFKDNPNGVVHFGSPFISPDGTTNFMNDDYGESTQNIYSQNGTGSTSQWKTAKGEDIRTWQTFTNWGFLKPFNNEWKEFAEAASNSDEDSILIGLYNQTIWDIIATYSLATADYTAAVVPFEFRSTVFFGKPNWPYEYKYDSEFKYDTATKNWQRSITNTHKKTFMQAHIYNSTSSILHNDIKASEEGVYTNVIVQYDGATTPVIQADNDIRLDKQKTTVVEANLLTRWGPKSGVFQGLGRNFWTSEASAQKYGHATVRDFMKDMYKGTLTVFGDPSVKPHDVVYLQDDVVDMNGIHLVKAVHHSMNMDTGFVTIIEPDAYVTNFNEEFLFMADKMWSTGKNIVGQSIVMAAGAGVGYAGSSMVKKLVNTIAFEANGFVSKVGASKVITRASEKMFAAQMAKISTFIDSPQDLKNLESALKGAKSFPEKIKVFEGVKDIITVSKADYAEAKVAVNAGKGLLSKAKGTAMMLDNAETVAENSIKAYKTANRLQAGATVAKGSSSLMRFTKSTVTVVTKFNLIGIALDVTFSVLTAGLGEMWFRKKQDSECVKIFPLKYKGQDFTAGINGHRGAVYGDTPSVNDKIMRSTWGQGKDPDVDGSIITWITKTINAVTK